MSDIPETEELPEKAEQVIAEERTEKIHNTVLVACAAVFLVSSTLTRAGR